MSYKFSSRVTTAPDVMFRVIGDEAVILNLKSELYLGLNPVGTRFWTTLHQAPSIQAAYESLLKEFEVGPEQLRQDLDNLLDQLFEQNLIQLMPAEAAASTTPRTKSGRSVASIRATKFPKAWPTTTTGPLPSCSITAATSAA